jgi:hypothetical protein
MPLAELAELKK